MNNWEYKIVVQHPKTTKKVYFEPTYVWEPEVKLDEMGKEGWELVSVASINLGVEGRSSELRYYFKRRIGG